MAAQFSNSIPVEKKPLQSNWLKQFTLFILFLLCGLAILVFGSNYFEIFPTNKNLTYNIIVSAVFMVAALLLRLNEPWKKY